MLCVVLPLLENNWSLHDLRWDKDVEQGCGNAYIPTATWWQSAEALRLLFSATLLQLFSAGTAWSKKKVHVNYDQKKAKWSSAELVREVSAVLTKVWTRPADLNSLQSFCVKFSEPMKGLSYQSTLSSCNQNIRPSSLNAELTGRKGWIKACQELSQPTHGQRASRWNNLSHLY